MPTGSENKVAENRKGNKEAGQRPPVTGTVLSRVMGNPCEQFVELSAGIWRFLSIMGARNVQTSKTGLFGCVYITGILNIARSWARPQSILDTCVTNTA